MTSVLAIRSGTRRSLATDTLGSLPSDVVVPSYDRSALVPAIVHIGVGGFHRAHQAVYLDALAHRGHRAWGEIGIGLRSPAMRAALAPQDCLFSVLERGQSGDRIRVVGAMTDYLYGPASPGATLDVLADERTRVVSLTVTGDAYNLDDAGRFRADAPEVSRDIARPTVPTTVQGYLVEALDRRRRAGLPAFTVMSCDNVPDNGAAARESVVGFARRRDPELAAWVEANASFPSSMVDRITPTTDDDVRRVVAGRLGMRDRSPVVAEEFSQWVVADDFCNGRPPLDEVGVQVVADVAPYALTKKRLLNGTHSALGYLGLLAGHRKTSDAMACPTMTAFVTTLMEREIGPLLPVAPGIALGEYQRTLVQRLGNVHISDELARLCGRGSTKMPAYLLPSLADARRQGRPAVLLTLALAGWLRYLRGYDLEGAPIEVVDAQRSTLQARARAGGNDPRALLSMRSVFGDLADDRDLVDALQAAVVSFEQRGVRETLRRHLSATARGQLLPAPAGVPVRPRVPRRRPATLVPAADEAMSA